MREVVHPSVPPVGGERPLQDQPVGHRPLHARFRVDATGGR